MRNYRETKPAYDQLLRENQLLKEQIKKLEEINRFQAIRIDEQARRIEELERKLGAPRKPDPSTPSAMTPPYLKPASKRRKKKPGAKKGHPGSRRAVPERIDERVEHKIKKCPECGERLGKPVETRKRYVEDLPPVRTTVTEHAINRYWCPGCKKIVEPKVEDALPRCAMGHRLLLMTAYMHYAMGTTVSNVLDWLKTFSSFEFSAGGLAGAWARLAQTLDPTYEEIRRKARESPVIHADETGWRVMGKTCWLWCFTNARLVYYKIVRSRGSPVIAEVLGKMIPGVLVSDFYGAYNLIEAGAKQRCMVHLFRELRKVMEKNTSAEWAAFCKKLKRLLGDAVRLSERREELPADGFAKKRARLSERLDDLCSASYSDPDCKRIRKRLRRHGGELFTFIDYPEVPADNNLAEREIRPAVVMRKNSYCNRSERGAMTQAVLMSVFRTLRLRGVHPVDFLSRSLRAISTTGAPLPLPASLS